MIISGCVGAGDRLPSELDEFGGVIDSADEGSEHGEPTQPVNLYNQPGPSIDEYLGEEVAVYYRKIVEEEIVCTSGDCPDEFVADEYFEARECFFCTENGSAVHPEQGRLIARIALIGGGSGSSSCWDSTTFNYPSDLAIEHSTDSVLVARGAGSGSFERSGDGCGTEFALEYSTQEVWVFSTADLMTPVVEEVTIATGESTIEATEWIERPMTVSTYDADGRLQSEQLSTKIVTEPDIFVQCTYPAMADVLDGNDADPPFWVRPTLSLVSINDRDVSERSWGASSWLDPPRVDSQEGGRAQFSVGAYHDGEYGIVGACDGPDGTATGNERVIVSVRGSPNGPFPMDTLEE